MTPTAPDAPSTSAARSLRRRAFCCLRSGLVGALAALVSALPRLGPILPARWLETAPNEPIALTARQARRERYPAFVNAALMMTGTSFGLSWLKPKLERSSTRSERTVIKGRFNRCGAKSTGPGPRRQSGKFGWPAPEWRGVRPLLVAAFHLLALFGADSRQTQAADGLSEAQIKAAYLYNFAKFVEWPDAGAPATADINLCVVGNNVLDGALESLDGRKAGERSLKVASHSPADTSLTDCHLLFVGASEQQRMVPILKNLGSAPVLTLSDIADFAEKGGGIALLFRDNKVVFEVNLESIRNAGLRLPGQLLNIATHVYGR